MKKTRREIDAAPKARIALEAQREQSSVADPAQRYGLHPNRTYSRKRQLQEQAARAFNAGVERDSERIEEWEIEKVRAKIGQPTMEERIFEPGGPADECS
jgi:transposase